MKGILPAALALCACLGCQQATSRIDEHAAEFAALDAATQQAIKQGIVQTGYSTDMVYMALGRPAETQVNPSGETVWLYHQYPVTAYNETIQAGFRRRVVYDPVKRSEDVVVEPIDTKAFPNLVPHTLRFTFRDNRLVSIERTPNG